MLVLKIKDHDFVFRITVIVTLPNLSPRTIYRVIIVVALPNLSLGIIYRLITVMAL